MGVKKNCVNLHEARIKKFDTDNFDLAFLASEAAIDMDNIIGERSEEDSSILYLSKLLNEATQERGSGEKPLAAHWQNALVLAYSILPREQFNKYWGSKSEEDVVMRTNLVAKELKNYRDLSKDRQRELTEFCVRLSREATNDYHDRHAGPCRLSA